MKKPLVLGILLLLAIVSLANVLGDEKTINTKEFSFGELGNPINLTEKELVIDGTLMNDTANLFIYNNATYDLLSFDVTAGPSPTGDYPSEVTIDIGNNGRPEYRFSGYGVGLWGNQVNFMDQGKNSLKAADIFPSREGNTYYVKLPSKAVATSATVDLTHLDVTVNGNVMIPNNGNNFASSYWYHYNDYGYSYYYPGTTYSTTYGSPNLYTMQTSGYTYVYGYPMANAYLKWNVNDPSLTVPAGANVMQYQLNWPIYLYRYSGTWPGVSGTYHMGQRTYGAFAVTSSWPSTTTSVSTANQYGGLSAEYNDFKNINPTWRSTPASTYSVGEYHGTTSGYFYNSNVVYDLKGLLQEWNSGSLKNNGIMVAMYRTPYCTMPHYSGYTYTNNNANRMLYYYRGYMYHPAASTSYNAYKPKLIYSYKLDSINPWVDIGSDGVKDWGYQGEYVGSTVLDSWEGLLNQYLRTHFPDEVDDYGNEWTYVPIKVGADSAGKITASNFRVTYNYTASVYFNPYTGTATKELNSLVPSTEEGAKLIKIMVKSNTQGKITLDNLKMKGEKPNYRPTADHIPDIEIDEGTVNSRLIPISDYFHDIDQDPATLDFRFLKNDGSGHADLYFTPVNPSDGKRYIGIDTTKDRDWSGEIKIQISAMDRFGKDVQSNDFKITILPVNDLPYVTAEMPNIITTEGINSILLEYNAPAGRDVANGKEFITVHKGGAPYFYDIENDHLYFDFELLDARMAPVDLAWSDDDGFKIYRTNDNQAYLTVLPPEYTEDPDNWILLFGSDPDFTTSEGPLYVNVFASDIRTDVRGECKTTFRIYVNSINDAPVISIIPDIILNEDEKYISPTAFVSEYVRDVDNSLNDLTVRFHSQDPSVSLYIDAVGRLHIDLDLDFNGVVLITMEVFDGGNTVVGSFYVRVRSVNDPPLVIVKNLYEGQRITELYRIKGTANDIEKNLQYVQVAVTEKGSTLYLDDWVVAEGAYVWQYLLDIREFEDGDYTVYVRGFDGRDYSEVQTFGIKVETPKPSEPSDPPVVTITTPMDGVLKDTVIVEGTVDDDSGTISFIEYRVDGSTWRKASMTSGTVWRIVIDTNTLANGDHNLSVRAYDGKVYSELVFKKFDVYNEDSDKDGIPNEVEIALLMDPFNKLDGTMDFDGDGFSNYNELMGKEKTDPFDANDHPESKDDQEPLIDTWALVLIIASIISAVIIMGLFFMNVRMEHNMQSWKEDLNRRRVHRRSKTLLQRIVEIAPTFIGGGYAEQGPALPGASPKTETFEALPPMREH
ncbi:MAG: Ig-like domain-containing protein [Thermoplasmatota archaeon]